LAVVVVDAVGGFGLSCVKKRKTAKNERKQGKQGKISAPLQACEIGAFKGLKTATAFSGGVRLVMRSALNRFYRLI
jgi:hypothetical protein